MVATKKTFGSYDIRMNHVTMAQKNNETNQPNVCTGHAFPLVWDVVELQMVAR